MELYTEPFTKIQKPIWPPDATHYAPTEQVFLKRENGVLYQKPFNKGMDWLPAEFNKIPRNSIKYPQPHEKGCPIYEMNMRTPILWPAAEMAGLTYGTFRKRLMKYIEAKNMHRWKEARVLEAQRKAEKMVMKAQCEAAGALRIVALREKDLCRNNTK